MVDALLKSFFEAYIGSWQTAWLTARLGLENSLLLNFEARQAEQDGVDVIAAVFDFVTAFAAIIRACFWCLLENIGMVRR